MNNCRCQVKLNAIPMTYLTYTPKPPLSELVELFWSDEGSNRPHAKERTLPSGTMELIVNLLDKDIQIFEQRDRYRPQSFRKALISGPHSDHFAIGTAQRVSVVGVHFKPGGAFPLLGLPASELRDANAPLDSLWGIEADELREQILEAETPEARFLILERALLDRIEEPPARHPAVAFALEEFRSVPHRRTISQVTHRIGVSHRHFIHVFSKEVGLTPKIFCRIQRFQKVLRLAEGRSAGRRRVDWAELALSYGYFDQAHLNRDFQAFSGLTPTAYLAHKGERQGERHNHITLDDH